MGAETWIIERMSTTKEFLDEVNEIFGFYFDVSMACHFCLEKLRSVQAQSGLTDASPFLVGDGPPQGSSEEQLKASLHDSTLGALKTRLKDGGLDIQKVGESAVVFTYHLWDEKYRGKITGADGKPKMNSDIMGDLRLIRNSIIHNKAVASPDVVRCKVITRFKPGEKIVLLKHDIYAIIRAIRADFQA
jgi:hypothetical protein